MSSSTLSVTSQLAVKTLASTRMLVGAGCLLIPAISSRFFGIGLEAPSRIFARLFGIRDLVLGAYLLTSYIEYTSSGSGSAIALTPAAGQSYWLSRELRRALCIGLICDSVDVCSSILCIWEGNLSGRAIPLIGGGAAAFASLGVVGLRSLS